MPSTPLTGVDQALWSAVRAVHRSGVYAALLGGAQPARLEQQLQVSLIHHVLDHPQQDLALGALLPLIRAGADPLVKNSYGHTPLIALLLKTGTVEPERSLAIHALLHLKVPLEESLAMEQVSYLGSPNPSDLGRCCPVSLVVQLDDVGLLEALLSAGASPDGPDDVSPTPLGMAASWRRSDAMNVLLHAGARINHADAKGQFPLMLAGAGPVRDQMLQAGANPELRGPDGATVLHHWAQAATDETFLRQAAQRWPHQVLQADHQGLRPADRLRPWSLHPGYEWARSLVGEWDRAVLASGTASGTAEHLPVRL